MSGESTREPKAGRYWMWSLLALCVLIPLWAYLSWQAMAAWKPTWLESDMMMRKYLVWSVAVPTLLVMAVAGWRWSEARASASDSAALAVASVSPAVEPDAGHPDYVLEVIGLGVTLDKYRQGKLWDALSKGNSHASIREQDPKKYPWSADEKEGIEGTRSGDTLENGARNTPMYWGVPTFGSDCCDDPKSPASPTDPDIGIAAEASSSGMPFHLFVSAGWELSERPDRLMERVFRFFDDHPDVPYVVVSGSDGMYFRDLYSPKGSPPLIKDGYYIPEMPDSSALFVLARRDRVNRIRPFAFDDFKPDGPGHVDELNKRGFARKLYLAYLNLSKSVPKPEDYNRRPPTVAEWLQEMKAFSQRDDIYPKHYSMMDAIEKGKHPPKDFRPTPWFPIPWNKEQLADFDQLPTLGFIHRPVFIKTVDEHGQPLSRRDARAAALAAGWHEALHTLPEAERKAAPARVVTASGGNVEQTIALHSVMSAWAQEGGPELDSSKPTKWIDTDARLGNTGAATWFMQMAIGVMGSYKEGGTSAAINLRDPREASIVFITPPSDEKRKSQQNAAGGDVWRSIVGPAIDPDNYKEP